MPSLPLRQVLGKALVHLEFDSKMSTAEAEEIAESPKALETCDSLSPPSPSLPPPPPWGLLDCFCSPLDPHCRVFASHFRHIGHIGNARGNDITYSSFFTS